MLYMNDATLNALTVIRPGSAELKARAAFWRKFAATIEICDSKTHATYNLVTANCSDMDAAADALAAGIAGPQIAALPVQPAAARAARKPAGLTAEQFWTLHTAAVQAIRATHGPRWYLSGETVCATVPARLCSYTGPLGGKIRFRRDHRFPAAQYWQNATIPAEIMLAPAWVPSSDFAAPERDILVWTRAAIADQIIADRQRNHGAAVDKALAEYDSALESLTVATQARIGNDSCPGIDGFKRRVAKACSTAVGLASIVYPLSYEERLANKAPAEAVDDAAIVADTAPVQSEAERLDAERAAIAAELDLTRQVRQAEHDDRLTAEAAEHARIDAEVIDQRRTLALRNGYQAWWRIALDQADIAAAIKVQRDAAELQATLANEARARLAAELAQQEERDRVARAADIGRGINAAINLGAARTERVVRKTIALVQAGRSKAPASSGAFNAGRAAFLASLQDAAD